MTVRIPLNADQEMASALRKLQSQIDELKNGPLDLQGRRVVNASNAKRAADYVTLQQMKDLLLKAGIKV